MSTTLALILLGVACVVFFVGYVVKNGRRGSEYDALEKEYGLEMEIVSNQLRIGGKTDMALKENGMLLKKIEDLQRKLDSVKIIFP